MGGTPANVNIWDGADVWIHRTKKLDGTPYTLADIRPTNVDEAFDEVTGADWELVGLLNGEDGFPEEISWDDSSHTAWGFGEIKKSFRNKKLERKFTGLEENAVTSYLESPGDTAEYVIDAKPANVFVAFETRTDEGKVKRRITTVPATVLGGGRTDNEQDMSSNEYTCSIFPDSQKRRFLKQETGDITSISVTPSTTELDLSDTETQQLAVVDNNAVDRTSVATYVSGTPGVATVSSGGLITPVSVGTATITVTYSGQTDTCVVTVIA